jgi:hypothetical protein
LAVFFVAWNDRSPQRLQRVVDGVWGINPWVPGSLWCVSPADSTGSTPRPRGQAGCP